MKNNYDQLGDSYSSYLNELKNKYSELKSTITTTTTTTTSGNKSEFKYDTNTSTLLLQRLQKKFTEIELLGEQDRSERQVSVV